MAETRKQCPEPPFQPSSACSDDGLSQSLWTSLSRGRLPAVTQIACHQHHSWQCPLVNLPISVTGSPMLMQNQRGVRIERRPLLRVDQSKTCLSQGTMHFMWCLFLSWKPSWKRNRVSDGMAECTGTATRRVAQQQFGSTIQRERRSS